MENEKQTIIFRYKNRKLYNSETSKYITVPQIYALVRDGGTVVIRQKGGSLDGMDMTASILRATLTHVPLSMEELINLIRKAA